MWKNNYMGSTKRIRRKILPYLLGKKDWLDILGNVDYCSIHDLYVIERDEGIPKKLISKLSALDRTQIY